MKRSQRSASRLLAPALIAIAFITMLSWTWNGWPDPIVDFGRELYVPWRITEGDVLYRDIAYFNGPLSPYFNALIFKLVGASLRTLVVTNIVIASAVAFVIYRLWRLAGGRFSATIAVLTFIALFMCIQIVTIGNYNWITPYSHEITHGVALSFATILAVFARRATLAGVLLGFVFLTKPEVFAAAAITAVVGTLLINRARVVALVLAATVPPIVAFVLLCFVMPLPEALHGTLGGWWYVFDQQLSGSQFYRQNMGTDQPASNLRIVAQYFIASLVIFVPAFLLDRVRMNRTARAIAAIMYAIALLLALMILQNRIAWPDVFRALTPISIIASIVLTAIASRSGGVRAPLRAMLAIFAAILLGKLLLVARIYHYGFALALPAMLVTFAMLISWIPRPRHAHAMRFAAIAVLGVVSIQYLREYANAFRHKPFVVAEGTSDEFQADPRGRAIDSIVQILGVFPRDATLAVVPDGVMINYLARLENPTGYVTLMPPEVRMFGQERILMSFKANPPDYVLLVEAGLLDYGHSSFADYMGDIYGWIQANYTPLPAPQDPAVRTMLLRRSQPDENR